MSLYDHILLANYQNTVNQQILAAIKFGVSQNKVIYVNLAAIKFGVSPHARLCSVRLTYMLHVGGDKY